MITGFVAEGNDISRKKFHLKRAHLKGSHLPLRFPSSLIWMLFTNVVNEGNDKEKI